MKKNILVIAPVMPQSEDIELFAQALGFLTPFYDLDFIDPLSLVDISLDSSAYYSAWQNELATRLKAYDAFIGFSFGGVILQQCFALFENQSRPIILISTPTFSDHALSQKLGKVIALCEQAQMNEALNTLYTHVFYPNPLPMNACIPNQKEAAHRLILGLKRVLNTDSSCILKTSSVRYLHLIGEQSDLVNVRNVNVENNGLRLIVPNAGMRVLQDNLVFCERAIMDKLS